MSGYKISETGNEFKDNETGLIWARCSVGQTWDGETCVGEVKKMTYEDAMSYADGIDGWRLPTIEELDSLTDRRFSSVIGTPNSWYWSSSRYAGHSNGAWNVNFRYGVVYGGSSDYNYAVRLVKKDNEMSKKIDSKIVKYEVVDPSQPTPTPTPMQPLHEKLDRPEVLIGSTYKVKTPVTEHALYITVNDIELEGKRHPFEIFINSKNMQDFQWIVALTRIISAVFRKGGEIEFLVDELRSVFDPKGGYFKKGGKYMPSLVAEIGDVIDTHLKTIGVIKSPEMDADRKAYIADKKTKADLTHAEVCPLCHEKAVVKVEGCMMCTACGASKCG